MSCRMRVLSEGWQARRVSLRERGRRGTLRWAVAEVEALENSPHGKVGISACIFSWPGTSLQAVVRHLAALLQFFSLRFVDVVGSASAFQQRPCKPSRYPACGTCSRGRAAALRSCLRWGRSCASAFHGFLHHYSTRCERFAALSTCDTLTPRRYRAVIQAVRVMSRYKVSARIACCRQIIRHIILRFVPLILLSCSVGLGFQYVCAAAWRTVR